MQLNVSKHSFQTKGVEKFKPLLAIASVLSLLTFVSASHAQSRYYDDDQYNQEPFISIFEDCGFRGERRDIAVGEFASMRELDFGNDKISSIRVPRELEAIIYEHDKFKGAFARVDRDVRCFDESWNDQVSSLRVESRQKGNRGVYGGNKPDRPRAGRPRDRDRNDYGRPQYNDGVTASNLARVVFNNKVLQQVGERTWELNQRRSGVSQFQETGRDRDAVYLVNKYSGARIEVNVPANVVTVFDARGKRERFAVNGRRAQLAVSEPAPPVDDTRIPGRCFDYKVYSDGGSASIRFSHEKALHRYKDRAHTSRICHRGELVIEIGKRDFNTDVTLEIGRRKYKFARGEKETQYRNHWYRKVMKLQVGG